MYCVDYQMSYPLLVVPYAPLLKKVKKSLITLIIKDFFFMHYTKPRSLTATVYD